MTRCDVSHIGVADTTSVLRKKYTIHSQYIYPRGEKRVSLIGAKCLQ